MRLFIALSAIISLFVSPVFSQDLTILYTGSSHSSLYPCGHCPASVGGGVSRRAAAVKKERAKDKDLILVDSGSVFAAGPLDEFSIGVDLDKQRTEAALRAMQAMKYDAAGIAEDEFRLGRDFFEKSINKTNFPFVSCNVTLKGVKPYIIKQAGSIRVGITGISPKSLSSFNVAVGEYEDSLSKAVSFFKKEKVGAVVLLSSLSRDETNGLLSKFPEINLVIFSYPSNGQGLQREGKTIEAYPYFQAKKIGKLIIKLADGNVKEYTSEDIALPLTRAEDPSVKKIIPECFLDSNCPEKEGMVRSCSNPGIGGQPAQCLYRKGKPLEAVVIGMENCPACSTKLTESFLKKYFRGVKFRKIDYKSPEAKKLIKTFGISTLPVFVFSRNVEEAQNFDELSGAFEKKGKKYFLSSRFSGIFYYLSRPVIDRKVDLFIEPFQKGFSDILRKVKTKAEKKKLNLEVHFIFKKGSLPEKEECLRILSVKVLYPNKFWKYLLGRVNTITSSFWNLPFKKLGIDTDKVTEFALSDKGEKTLKDNNSLSAELGINRGGVILLNNNRIFSFQVGGGSLDGVLDSM